MFDGVVASGNTADRGGFIAALSSDRQRVEVNNTICTGNEAYSGGAG